MQLPPQLIPAGEDVTVPAPLPPLLIVIVNGAGGARFNMALTVASPASLTAPCPGAVASIPS